MAAGRDVDSCRCPVTVLVLQLDDTGPSVTDSILAAAQQLPKGGRIDISIPELPHYRRSAGFQA
jgi:hypothetical protein